MDVRLLGSAKATKNVVCVDDVTTSILHILETTSTGKGYHLTSSRPLDGMNLWRSITKALRIEGIRYVGEAIEKPTALERNIMCYTAPFLPYTINLDPIWLLTNTNKALGRKYARTPMSEAVLTELLSRFMAEELSVGQVATRNVRDTAARRSRLPVPKRRPWLLPGRTETKAYRP